MKTWPVCVCSADRVRTSTLGCCSFGTKVQYQVGECRRSAPWEAVQHCTSPHSKLSRTPTSWKQPAGSNQLEAGTISDLGLLICVMDGLEGSPRADIGQHPRGSHHARLQTRLSTSWARTTAMVGVPPSCLCACAARNERATSLASLASMARLDAQRGKGDAPRGNAQRKPPRRLHLLPPEGALGRCQDCAAPSNSSGELTGRLLFGCLGELCNLSFLPRLARRPCHCTAALVLFLAAQTFGSASPFSAFAVGWRCGAGNAVELVRGVGERRERREDIPEWKT